MRKLMNCLCIGLLFVVFPACNEEETLTPQQPQGLETQIAENNSSLIDLNSDEYLEKVQNARLAGWVEKGPFSVNASLTKIISYNSSGGRGRVYLSNSQSPYASGYYLCDIYRSSANIALPAGAILAVHSANKSGFTNYSAIPTKPTGYSVISSNNNTHEFVTYSIVPRYTLTGASLGGVVLPQDLNGTNYTYTYLINE